MQKTVPRKIIAVDVDDVLAANAEGFINFSNERWGTHLKPEDFTENWAEMWQVEHDEWVARRQDVIESKVHMTYRFFDEAKPVLKKLSESYTLVVVSSRSKQISSETTHWLKKEYGKIFSDYHYAKIWDDMDKPIHEKINQTKKDVLEQIGADFLIDDQPKHCIAAADAGIKCLLFGNYEWNKHVQLPEGVVRVSDWKTVWEYFHGRD